MSFGPRALLCFAFLRDFDRTERNGCYSCETLEDFSRPLSFASRKRHEHKRQIQEYLEIVVNVLKVITLSAIRPFCMFCKQFSESSPCLPGKQGSCITTVELSDNILQNLENDLMPDSVQLELLFLFSVDLFIFTTMILNS